MALMVRPKKLPSLCSVGAVRGSGAGTTVATDVAVAKLNANRTITIPPIDRAGAVIGCLKQVTMNAQKHKNTPSAVDEIVEMACLFSRFLASLSALSVDIFLYQNKVLSWLPLKRVERF